MSTYHLEETLRPDLLPGERIVWAGRPVPGHLFTASDVFLVPFSLLWGGFALFWEAGVLGLGPFGGGGRSAPAFFALWGVPFVLMGLYFIIGRFFYKVWRKRRTIYAVTDRRVLLLTTTFGRRVQAAFLNVLPGISTSVSRDGVGTITFGSGSVIDAWYGNTGMELFGWGRSSGTLAFYDVPDAAGVAAMVSERQRTTGAERP